MEFIEKERNGRDVYVMGYTNGILDSKDSW